MKTFVLIDRSGSMGSHWDEMMGAMGSFMEGIKGKAHIAVFDGNGVSLNYDPVHDGKAKKFDQNEMLKYRPRGTTPLYDAVHFMHTFHVVPSEAKKAQIVIITDGHENASKSTSLKVVKGVIKGWEKKGYDVIFLGASFDEALAAGTGMGLSAGKTVNMAKSSSFGETMSFVSTRNMSYASGETKGSDDLEDEITEAAGK